MSCRRLNELLAEVQRKENDMQWIQISKHTLRFEGYNYWDVGNDLSSICDLLHWFASNLNRTVFFIEAVTTRNWRFYCFQANVIANFAN